MYYHPDQATALNRDSSSLEIAVALCFALPADGTVPEWVQLLPAGNTITGIDGRTWINDNPQGVVDYFNSLNRAGRGLPFDWEHATELKAPKGDEAPASAWGQAMELREDGSIWAKPEWTARGRNSVASKEYKYLSPVLVYLKSTGQVVGIKSVGLTNQPNFTMTALNHAQSNNEEPSMKLVLAALGLAATATEADAVNAINTINSNLATANNRAQNPDLSAFVPKADHELALNRAQSAEKKLADIEQEKLDADIETAINQALKDRKISPASVDYHTANCRAEGGLNKFKAYVESAPALLGDQTLEGKQVPEGDAELALNAEQQQINEIFGNSVEDLKKYA